MRELAGAGRIELRQTVTRNADEGWSGTRGRINRVELQRLIHDVETLCFVCGPPSLVAEMPALLGEVGVERRRIRLEEW